MQSLSLSFLVATLCSLMGQTSFASQSTIQIDRTLLSPSHQALVESDLNSLSNFSVATPIDGSQPDPSFAQIFGGTSGSDVIQYLEERVHYLGSDPDQKDGLYAYNYSPSFLAWLYERDILQKPNAHPTQVTFENIRIDITSTRIGFIAIGPVYTDPSTTWVDRLDTLVHEARHSDCSAMPNSQDLTAYGTGQYLNMSPEGLKCALVHMPCPKGHPLVGQLACDAQDWGAYTVGYVFSKSVYHSCSTCTEKDRQAGLATATDDFSRLFDDVQQRLLTHTAGVPDMSSIDPLAPSN
jgi:hypothetical protein